MEKFIYETPQTEIVELAAEAAYCLASSLESGNEQWKEDEF